MTRRTNWPTKEGEDLIRRRNRYMTRVSSSGTEDNGLRAGPHPKLDAPPEPPLNCSTTVFTSGSSNA